MSHTDKSNSFHSTDEKTEADWAEMTNLMWASLFLEVTEIESTLIFLFLCFLHLQGIF